MIWLDIQNYNPADTANATQVLPFYGAAESLLAALGAFLLVLLAVAFIVHLARWAFGVHVGHASAGGALHALIVIFLAIVGVAAAAALTNHFFHWGQQVIH
ncbi:MAG TPA: hypothetical protein VFD01_15315 [Candidatus Dormibacteraeota bacterium]|jgi:hypothetical protein|nr:hypothetical protein [Candidatus Dormibacteraeota bacterium]